MNEKINAVLSDVENALIELRHEFHRFPEVGFCEKKTAETISKMLKKWDIEHKTGIYGTGILANIGKDDTKKTLLLRADMDALPQTEATNLPYSSENVGVMHACGHDVHMTVVLGTAYVLNKLKDELSCNVKFVFQPCEEDAGGALGMIEEGVLKMPEVTAAAACHVSNDVECGKICIKEGACMASPDDFDIVIKGKGGHGAYPEKCTDPIAIAAEVISAFSVLSSRFSCPTEPKVISVCKIEGGSCYNIIPDEVLLCGTVRTFNEDLRRALANKIEETVKNITHMFGADYSFDYRFRYPPLVNDAQTAKEFAASAEKILGAENVYFTDSLSMAGEDFAYFARAVPSVFFNLGTKNEKIGATEPLHSSSFIVDDRAIAVGVKAMARFALDFGK